MAINTVLFITDYFAPPYDEGIKKTAYNIFRLVSERYNVKVLCRDHDDGESIKKIECNRVFLSLSVFKTIRSLKPKAVLYLPFASFTLGGYFRNVILGLMGLRARYLYIGLQPKPAGAFLVSILGRFQRGVGFTPSIKLHETWKKLGKPSRLVPLFTDLKRFKPAYDPLIREQLRNKFGIPQDAFVISHVGHLTQGRNLESLIPLQQAGYYVFIVCSTSTPEESKAPDSLKSKLLHAGVRIHEGLINDISEIYFVSNLYIFPVLDDCSSIGLPLSILEARACGIPVLTTEYGSVKLFLNDDNGGVFYSSPEFFGEALQTIKETTLDSNVSVVSALNSILSHELFQAIDQDAV